MFPDTPTVALMSMLLATTLGFLLLWLWRRDRTLRALPFWGIAYLVVAVGAVLLAARGSVPNRLSIDVAVGTIILGYSLGWMGARRFEHRPIRIPAAAAGVVLWLVACQVPAFYQSLAYRAGLASLIMATYEVLSAREFLRKHESGDLPSRRALAIVFAMGASFQTLRVVVALTIWFHQPTFNLPTSVWFGLPGAVGSVLGAITSVLLIAVAKEDAERSSIAILAAARDSADRANLAKSRFLARMSHELRTPLNAVLGMAQVLTRDPSLAAAQKERAQLLERSGRHLLALINDILDLASTESGSFRLAPVSIRVSDTIQGSVDLVAGSATAKHIALTVEIDPDVPVALLGDQLRIRQILLNLLGNAIKFTPSGGSVWLRVSPLQGDSGLRLSVTDTGPGVPPDFAPHLFKDFAQRPVDAGSVGTGLGLAISASLAQAMGGRIAYRPGPGGKGSIFTVALPLPRAEPPAPASPDVAPTAIGLRVLVVDDVASNRKLAEVLLQQAGHTVALASDGAAALAQLGAGPVPDVVLMDVQMPGMDGLVATQRVRALPGPAGSVPIIAVTADASPEKAEVYRAAGMDGFVAKPVDLDTLARAIAQVAPTRASTRGSVSLSA